MKIVMMSVMRIPNQDEINAAYAQGRIAVIALIQETFLVFAERIKKLEDQLAQDSGNSGEPFTTIYRLTFNI